jgi:outer membrane protein OmpA-like peptidoglycan-associated protein
LCLRNGILIAEGSASHQWVSTTRQVVLAIPGVMGYQEDNLVDEDIRQLYADIDTIEKQVLRFIAGTAELVPDQGDKLHALLAEIRDIQVRAKLIGQNFHIKIVGHSDTSGTEETNTRLSQARADHILSLLVAAGITPSYLSAVGVGTREPVSKELTEQDRAINRCVTFRVLSRESSLTAGVP